MTDTSTWLRYLPPVLWRDDPTPPAFGLGTSLRIFEKLLTGIPDGHVVHHEDHEHEPVRAVIDRIHQLFDPWATPPEFLDWLASWVALELPEIWDEYQRRKITSEIVDIYRRRGVKDGLDQYLDLYTVAETRPRIVVDDCSKVLWLDRDDSTRSPMTTLLSQLPIAGPLSLARGPDGSLFVGDHGALPANDELVWRIPPPGRYDVDSAPPVAVPLDPTTTAVGGFNLSFPVALETTGKPVSLFVLDRVLNTTFPALWQLPAPDYATAAVVADRATLGTNWPVDMAADANGNLLILDRGAPGALPANPMIIEVQVAPFVATIIPLTDVVEPLSLAVHESGDLIIGDGRDQKTALPGDLVRVDRSTAPWTETRQLAPLVAWDENPIVNPIAITVSDDVVHVADIGYKPLAPELNSPYIKEVAEQGAVYRVDLTAVPPTVDLASDRKQLVHPTAMIEMGGRLYVTDRGEYSDTQFAGSVEREWRATTGEFGVVVHFSSQRPTTPTQRRRIVRDVLDIADQQAPAHTQRSFVFAV